MFDLPSPSLMSFKKFVAIFGLSPRKKKLARRSARSKRHVQPLVEQLETRDTPSATLVASSYYDGAVYEFDAGTGALKTTLVAPYTSPLLSGPAGMTQGPDGNLYISSQFNDSIVRINLTTNVATTFLTANDLHPFVTATGNSVFFPSGLQFGPDGNLYVCLFGGQGSTTGGVVRFNIASNSGALSYAGTGTLFGSGLSQPTALLFGPAGDTTSLYVSNAGADDVVKITNATSATPITTTFVAPGSGGVNYPAGLAWGPDQKFYVTDLGATSFQGNVLQFNADGSFTKVMTPGGPVGNLFGQFPSSVLFDGQGHFFTANLGTYPPNLQGSINEYNNDGSFAQTLVSSSQFPNTGPGTSGVAPSQFILLPPLTTVTHFVVSAPAIITSAPAAPSTSPSRPKMATIMPCPAMSAPSNLRAPTAARYITARACQRPILLPRPTAAPTTLP